MLFTHFPTREVSYGGFYKREIAQLLLFPMPNPFLDLQLVACKSEPNSRYLSSVHVVWFCSPKCYLLLSLSGLLMLLKQWNKRQATVHQKSYRVLGLFLFCTCLLFFPRKEFPFQHAITVSFAFFVKYHFPLLAIFS